MTEELCSPDELRTLFLFEKLTDDQLDWLCRRGRVEVDRGQGSAQWHQGVAQLARPAQMRLHVIDTDRDNAGMLGGKRLAGFVEADDLGRTDKREIVRIEEQHDHLGIDLRKPQPSGAIAGRTGKIEWRRSVSRLQHLRTRCGE